MEKIEYKVDDCNLSAQSFVSFVNRIWPGNYDIEKTEKALSKTINITAYDGSTLTGCLRILTDGCYFGTITELLVLPEYQKKGSEAGCFSLQRNILRLCCISARSPDWKAFMKRTDVREACSLI